MHNVTNLIAKRNFYCGISFVRSQQLEGMKPTNTQDYIRTPYSICRGSKVKTGMEAGDRPGDKQG